MSAPGVDILVPAPENTYQLTTGTSVAAAEVSGIVALLLERNPKLTPADIRRILQSSARRLGARRARRQFRLGLSRSAQGTTARYSANRCHDSAADAVVTCGRPVGTANLMSWTKFSDLFWRAGDYVDRILRGDQTGRHPG